MRNAALVRGDHARATSSLMSRQEWLARHHGLALETTESQAQSVIAVVAPLMHSRVTGDAAPLRRAHSAVRLRAPRAASRCRRQRLPSTPRPLRGVNPAT
jgi:hypothetical protein